MAPIELDPIPEPNYPVGSEMGSSEGSGHSYERAAGELLHRPHAFALMHGDGGVKVAYGELHYRVDSFELKFNQQDLTCTIDDHPDHAHEHDHTHTVSGTTGAAPSSSGSESVTGAANPVNTSGDQDSGGGYYSTDGHIHPHAHTHTIPEHTHTFSDTSSSPNEATTSGVKATDGSTYSGSGGNLSHTCTVSPARITYCSGAKQAGIGNITQVTPKIGPEPEDYTPPAEGEEDEWPDMDPTIPSIYHQLVGYGDVYLCWKVDTENVANEVEKCWVQVGDPDGDPVGGITMGTTTTDRRAAGDPKDSTGQPEGDDKGVYKIKLGTVNIDSQITQNVSNDVSWNTVVMDRLLTTNDDPSP